MTASPATIRRIKEAVDLPSIIQEYAPLKKSGTNLIGLCCFHKEKTPSLRVHQEYWHCFGCGAGGDVITFVSKIEGISPWEAIKALSERTGIPLDADAKPQSRAARVYDREEAAFTAWWHKRQCERLAARLSAYVRVLDTLSTEEECEAAGLLWRQMSECKGDQLRRLVLVAATEEDRREWKASLSHVQRWDRSWQRCLAEIERCKSYSGPQDMMALLGWADWEAEQWLIEEDMAI